MAGEAGVGASVGDFLGSIVGEILSAPDRAKAEKLREQAMAQFDIELPPLEELRANALESQAAKAQGSQESQGIRLDALRQIGRMAKEGYTPEDRAAMAQTLEEAGQWERGQREAALRGVAPGSGARVAAQLAAQQGSATRANREGLSIAAEARRRAERALAQQGQLAGDIDESTFRQNMQRGAAGDAFAQFNEKNRLDVARGNMDAKQQQFGNKLQLAQNRAGQLTAQERAALEEAKRKGGVARGVGRGAGTLGGYVVGAL